MKENIQFFLCLLVEQADMLCSFGARLYVFWVIEKDLMSDCERKLAAKKIAFRKASFCGMTGQLIGLN